MGGSVVVELSFTAEEPMERPFVWVKLHTLLGQDIVAWRTQDSYGEMDPIRRGGVIRLHIRDLNLVEGLYNFAIGLKDGEELVDYVDNALAIEVTPKKMDTVDDVSPARGRELIYTPCHWDIDYN
jgi:hypothetical protein